MSLSCMHHYPCCTDEEGEAKAESIQPSQDGMASTQREFRLALNLPLLTTTQRHARGWAKARKNNIGGCITKAHTGHWTEKKATLGKRGGFPKDTMFGWGLINESHWREELVGFLHKSTRTSENRDNLVMLAGAWVVKTSRKKEELVRKALSRSQEMWTLCRHLTSYRKQ